MAGSEHKTALVTGAGKRIGRATALHLASLGYAVGVHCNRSRADADAVVAEIRATGGRAATLQADLSREAEVSGLIPAAVTALGPIGVLVNNASVFENDGIADATRESWDLHMETNLRAPFVLSQAFARQLPDGDGGCIVNIIDQRVWNLTPHFLSYTLSKAGLWTLTRTLALALAPRIRVNAVGPGPTLPSKRQTEEEFREQCRSLPLCEGTSPEEIARTVAFLIETPSVTGQMIAVDGGEHLGWAQPSLGYVPRE